MCSRIFNHASRFRRIKLYLRLDFPLLSPSFLPPSRPSAHPPFPSLRSPSIPLPPSQLLPVNGDSERGSGSGRGHGPLVSGPLVPPWRRALLRPHRLLLLRLPLPPLAPLRAARALRRCPSEAGGGECGTLNRAVSHVFTIAALHPCSPHPPSSQPPPPVLIIPPLLILPLSRPPCSHLLSSPPLLLPPFPPLSASIAAGDERVIAAGDERVWVQPRTATAAGNAAPAAPLAALAALPARALIVCREWGRGGRDGMGWDGMGWHCPPCPHVLSSCVCLFMSFLVWTVDNSSPPLACTPAHSLLPFSPLPSLASPTHCLPPTVSHLPPCSYSPSFLCRGIRHGVTAETKRRTFPFFPLFPFLPFLPFLPILSLPSVLPPCTSIGLVAGGFSKRSLRRHAFLVTGPYLSPPATPPPLLLPTSFFLPRFSSARQPVEMLPELPEIAPKDEAMLQRRRRMASFWRYSAYYVDRPPPDKGVAADIAAYTKRHSSSSGAAPSSSSAPRASLADVMDLSIAHYPAELLSTGGKKKVRKKSGNAWVVGKGSAANGQSLPLSLSLPPLFSA
ncbi:unnamed protein product [Closterium sp. NIES-54]